MAKYKLSERISKQMWDLAGMLLGEYPVARAIPIRRLTEDQLAEELKGRLLKIPYPYKPTRAQGEASQSTYVVLENLNLMDAFFDSGVLRELQFWSSDYLHFSLNDIPLHFTNNPAGKEFRQFHVSMARELIRHLETISKLKETYRFEEDWIGPYYRTAWERLLWEVATVRRYTEGRPDPESEVLRDSIRIVYSIIREAFQKKKFRNDALCRHLTSLAISPNSRTTGHLYPDPEAVRKSLERGRDKKSK